ncbi:MAG: FlgD immunoglobulin-like domain containing protein, partial [Candidatus Neomarinimicrobiota bacterium]|nr:FlgD immunoglobulin-like domain containing protein [Candidatus Neomarinimicrobiota bacterium]
TTVSYDLALDGEVSLTVYNMRGEIMSTLVSGHQHAGSHEATWNGMTDTGNEAASGVYFFKLEANDFVQINKAVLIK